MPARPWIGQRVRWRLDGRLMIGHVVTCDGPREDGAYNLIVERRRPGDLHRLWKRQRGLYTTVKEVHRYEMRLHTLPRHQLGQPAVPARATA